MADLVSGRYHQVNPLWSYLGQPVNATQSDVPQFSNLDIAPGLVLTDGAAFATGVATAVAIPVDIGAVITKIGILVGATAEATGTHAAAALYSGIAAPAIMGTQATDLTGATAIGPASALFTFTLPTPQQITPANAPNGFIYASITCTATTQPTCASFTLATAVAYQWFTNSPLKMGALTHGSALAGVMPATIASPSAQAVTPVMFLS